MLSPTESEFRTPGRFSFTLIVAAFLIAMIGPTLPTPLYPIYQTQMGYSQIMITVIFAAYALGVIGALIAFGSWSDQLGRRRVLLGGLTFAILSDAIFIASPELTPLLIGRVLSGASAGIFTGTATVAVVEQAPPEWKNGATLAATATNMLGIGLGPVFAGVLAQYVSWPLHLPYALHLVACLLVAAGVCYAPETVRPPQRLRLHVQRLALPAEVRRVFIPAGIAGFAGTAVLGLFTAVLPAVAQQLLGIHNLALIGAIIFVLFLSSALGQASMTLIATRQRLIVGCAVLAVGALLLCTAVALSSLALTLGGAVIAGLGQGVALRSGLGEVVSAAPARQRGEVTSTFFVVIYVAISLPVVGLGITIHLIGLQSAGIAFALLVAALALIAMALLIRLRRLRAAGAH
ncbi:MFS transporter [Kushneria aurantia]|uniref:MFS transporter n=1 Tax=Kushneria aurantia TaxID=504092 RepID=A0ABV6G211_9GAMM|nr:MFS transporter [Kushneria aurantia]